VSVVLCIKSSLGMIDVFMAVVITQLVRVINEAVYISWPPLNAERD